MKKYALIAIAALTMSFAACGEKEGEKANNGNKAETETKTETKAADQDVAKSETKAMDATKAEPSYITYTNDKYGFTVEVPSGMKQKGELMGDEGTVYVLEDNAFNSIGISGGKDFFDEEYTPEKVKEDFEYYIENKEVTSEECGDNYFKYTLPGEINEITYHLYKGSKKVMVTVYYEAEHEQQLAGDVAKHVFESVKFKD